LDNVGEVATSTFDIGLGNGRLDLAFGHYHHYVSALSKLINEGCEFGVH
jgi:hypothetical protein